MGSMKKESEIWKDFKMVKSFHQERERIEILKETRNTWKGGKKGNKYTRNFWSSR